MNILLDANVLLRLADPSSATHTVAARVVAKLRAQGHPLYLVPQSIYEFWSVATRPIANNGLGLTAAECLQDVAQLKAAFALLDDLPRLYVEWETLVSAFACHGKTAHDARYVAAMRTQGLTHLLTFNAGDFTRYPGLTILDPTVMAASDETGTRS